MLITPDKGHKVFANVSIAGFRNRKLKDYLVTAALCRTNKAWKCELYRKKSCLACNSNNADTNLKKETCKEIFKIQSGSLNCYSKTLMLNC